MHQILKGVVQHYNQHGEGVVFYQNKPVYIYGVIKGEEISYTIVKVYSTYFIGELIQVNKKSPHRVDHQINDAHLIGGYDLIHMDEEEQKRFKVHKVLYDFEKIAQIKVRDYLWIGAQKKTKYRNKITVYNGSFYQKRTNKPIVINDFLLSDIPWDSKRHGTIIYRQLDTLISGTKEDQLYTTDSMLGYQFRVGLHSFYQVNKEMAQKAYQLIRDSIIYGGKTLDLYCGIGTISLICSKNSSIVHGIEIDSHSYHDALYNKELNGVENVSFFHLSVEKYFQKYHEQFDTVVVDPPRRGLNRKMIEKIKNEIRPQRIIYMSCHPATQAANISWLKDQYELVQLAIIDMFPQTYHVETVAILNLKKEE